MYPYQNFLMNSFPQNQQPMYQPMQNPYVERLTQMQSMQNMQQPQMQMQNIGISGRIVEDFNVIGANDVPMDNIGAVFMKKDGSELQHKIWTADGKILTTQYKPILDNKGTSAEELSNVTPKTDFGAFQNVLEGITKKLDSLYEKVESIMVQSPKKEVE